MLSTAFLAWAETCAFSQGACVEPNKFKRASSHSGDHPVSDLRLLRIIDHSCTLLSCLAMCQAIPVKQELGMLGPFEFVHLVRLVRFVCFVWCIEMQIDGPWVDSCDVSTDFTRTISHLWNVWGFLRRCSSKANVPWCVLCRGFVQVPKICTTSQFFCTVKCYLVRLECLLHLAARWCSRSSRWGSEHRGIALA